jgi:CheY-like chemotaxis protein
MAQPFAADLHSPHLMSDVAVIDHPRRGSILVVEDREDVRQGLAQLLEMHGFLVSDVGDGQDALAQLDAARGTVALILLDLVLPGSISGQDVRRRQLADMQLAHIPTIVITACDLGIDERRLLHPDAWLDKPFRCDDLLALVKRYVVPGVHTALSDD